MRYYCSQQPPLSIHLLLLLLLLLLVPALPPTGTAASAAAAHAAINAIALNPITTASISVGIGLATAAAVADVDMGGAGPPGFGSLPSAAKSSHRRRHLLDSRDLFTSRFMGSSKWGQG